MTAMFKSFNSTENEATGSVHRTYPIVSKSRFEATGYVRRINRVRSWKLVFSVIALFGAIQIGSAGETVRIEITEKIDQNTYPKSLNACGPTCMLMQFQNGTPEMQAAHGKLIGSDSAKRINYLIERHFKKKRSVISPELYRWGINGVLTRDMEAAADDWMEENGLDRLDLSGSWLDRENVKEKDSEMVRRIHRMMKRSLEAGVPPILSLKSFVAREKLNKPGEMEWRIGQHHYVLITEVPDSLIRGDEVTKTVSSQGFKLGIIDPNGGMESEIFVFHDSNGQPFTAQKGNGTQGKWISGKPFLQVAAPTVPTLKPANLKWSERVVTIANHLMGKF